MPWHFRLILGELSVIFCHLRIMWVVRLHILAARREYGKCAWQTTYDFHFVGEHLNYSASCLSFFSRPFAQHHLRKHVLCEVSFNASCTLILHINHWLIKRFMDILIRCRCFEHFIFSWCCYGCLCVVVANNLDGSFVSSPCADTLYCHLVLINVVQATSSVRCQFRLLATYTLLYSRFAVTVR